MNNTSNFRYPNPRIGNYCIYQPCGDCISLFTFSDFPFIAKILSISEIFYVKWSCDLLDAFKCNIKNIHMMIYVSKMLSRTLILVNDVISWQSASSLINYNSPQKKYITKNISYFTLEFLGKDRSLHLRLYDSVPQCYMFCFSRKKLNVDVVIYSLCPSWRRLVDPLKHFLKLYFVIQIRSQT